MLGIHPQPRQLQQRLAAAVSAAVYAVFLMALANSPVVTYYSIYGFSGKNPTAVTVLAVALAAGLIGFSLPVKPVSPAKMTLWLLALLLTIPTLAVAPSIDRQGVSTLVELVVLGHIATLATYTFVPVRLSVHHRFTRSDVLWATAGVAIVLTAVAVISYGFRTSFANLQQMYAIRAEFTDISLSGNPITAYSIGWVTKVFSPFLISAGIVWSRWWACILGITIQIALYAVNPQKLNVALTLAVIMISVALKRSGRKQGREIQTESLSFTRLSVLLLAAGAVIVALMSRPGNDIFNASVYRTLFVPMETALTWVEYFSANPPGLFADAVPFVTSDYPQDLPSLIMTTEYGIPGGSANAHYLVDGYGNLGLVGVLIVSLILGVYLKLLDSVARGGDLRVCTAIMVGPCVSLTNLSMFTSLISGGLVIAAIMVALTPAGEDTRASKVTPVRKRTLGLSRNEGTR